MIHDIAKTAAEQAEHARAQMLDGIIEELTRFYAEPAKLMIDRPSDLVVAVHGATTSDLALEARPHPDDASKLIGSKGVMFHSFRSAILQYAANRKMRIHYRLDTPRPGGRRPEPAFVARADWPRERLLEVFSRMLAGMFDNALDMEAKDSADTTRIWVTLHPDEPVHLSDAELKDALSRIWHAIGRSHGRVIYLDALARGRQGGAA